MAPKKKQQQQTMSLGDFLNEGKYGGSWADEVEDSYGSQPLPAPSSSRMGGGYSSYSAGGGFGGDRGYAVRDSFPTELPTKPPYTAHLGNLSYDATSETVTEFFEGCDLTSVRIIEDRIENRPKGFAYAEFKDVEGLKRALELDGEQFQGRNIRVKIADPPKNDRGMGDRDRGGESALNLSSWERKGPLAALPGREPERRNDFGGERRDFGERRNDFGERRAPREFAPADENKGRDFSNLSWERRGPLSPVAQPERSSSRASSRPGVDDGNRADSMRERKGRTAPAWGEGRPEGSRPPREHSERPDRPERTPTAAELDNKWRSNMRPDAKSPESEAPASPSAAPAAPAGRPRLNLQKRTVSEVPGVTSPATASASDAKGNPFGAARPIDTAARERELLQKKEQAAKEKAEAEEKAKEERRLAKEAAAEEAAQKAAAAAEAEKEAAEKAEKEAAEKAANAEAEPPKTEEAPKETEGEGEGAGEQKALPTRPRESAPKSRAAESGSWRASGDGRSARGGYQNAPRGRAEYRGGRGGGRGRGDRGGFGEGRGHRANGSQGGQQSVPSTPITEEPATPQDPDGWQTVSKGRRGRA